MAEFSPLNIAFLLFPHVTQLDLTGPAQVLSRLGNSQIELVWKNTDPVKTDVGFSIVPTATFDDITKTDILCIPGGIGTVDIMQDEAVLQWVRTVSKTATWITSVCTGSLVLGAAGLLKDFKATTHWASIELLPLFGATPVKERIVIDQNRITGGGVTSGIDFALCLAEKIRGTDHAKLIQLAIEYDPAPKYEAGSPETIDPKIVKQYADIVNMHAPNREAKIKEIAKALGF